MVAADEDPILTVRELRTHFPVRSGTMFAGKGAAVRAVDGVSFDIGRGEILGLVGESGCGKTTLSRTLMQLIPATSGEIRFQGCDLTALTPGELRRRRLDIQMVFQDPFASLNPRMTIFDALAEALQTRRKLRGRELRAAVAGLMREVGLTPAQMRKYPHEFSGGQRQRIAIARALAPQPRLIIADEPVSALDVSIQAQILNLMARLVREHELAMLFISHDLSVVRYIADRIAVMYLGQLVELGGAETVMDHPLHAYTRALVSAIPRPDPRVERTRRRIMLKGDPPSPANPPEGARFAPRSYLEASPDERKQTPRWIEVAPGHWVEVHPTTVENWREFV